MNITIPEFSLVFIFDLPGIAQSLAKNLGTEVLSFHEMHRLVSAGAFDNETRTAAFDVISLIVRKRMEKHHSTIIDSQNLGKRYLHKLLALCEEYYCLPCALSDVNVKIAKEPFFYFYALEKDLNPDQLILLKTQEEIKKSLQVNQKDQSGPFDIVGDVHGCYRELIELLIKLGYEIDPEKIEMGQSAIKGLPARKVVFLGDLIDRGPQSLEVLALVMNMVKYETALFVPGNHDMKLRQFLNGVQVERKHGLDKTVDQLQDAKPQFIEELKDFLNHTASHYVLDRGKLVVAHAGMTEALQGKNTQKARRFALYGETTGELDEFGLPVRHNWALNYQGKAMVVYGHTAVPNAEWLNNTICIDTGCVFGGKLTALRYPENEVVSVNAKKVYWQKEGFC